jgi:hypothetical protein
MRDAHQVVVDYWDAAANRDWATFSDLLSDQVAHQAPRNPQTIPTTKDNIFAVPDDSDPTR